MSTPRTDALCSEPYKADTTQGLLNMAVELSRDLERENAALRHDIECAVQRNSDLIAENEKLRVDAERYRWLRNGNSTHCKAGIWVPSLVYSGEDYWPNKEDADALIDAARKESA
jgi:hypothetical protein